MIQLNWFKTAWRNIRRNISSTVINVGGLTVGFSGAMLIFCLVYYHLSFDDFHTDKDRIYRMVSVTYDGEESFNQGIPQPAGAAFKNAYPYAEQLAMRVSINSAVVSVGEGSNKKVFQLNGAYTQPSFFSVFNYPFRLGNADVLSVPGNMVITEKEADKLFPGENAIGKEVMVNGKMLTIAGVLKDIPVNTMHQRQFYVSYENFKIDQPWMAGNESWPAISSGVQCYLKLNKNVDPALVEKELVSFVKHYDPDKKTTLQLHLQPLRDIHFNLQYDGYIAKKQLWSIGLIGLFLLLTAAINFINLSTAQVFFRTKETGVRKALGSSDAQIRSQYFIEAFILSALAILLSAALVVIVFPYFNSFCGTSISYSYLYRYQFILFTSGLVAGISLLVGYFPGKILSRLKPVEIMKGAIMKHATGGIPLRKVLVVAQFAIVLFMISSTEIVSHQLDSAIKGDLGFKQSGIVLLNIPGGKNETVVNSLRNQLNNITGVEGVSACYAAPMSGMNNLNSFKYDHQPKDAPFDINIKAVDTGYLKTFGLQLLAGRNLFAGDSVNGVIVNETFVKKIQAGSPAAIVGKSVTAFGKDIQIVGVVKDFHTSTFHSPIEPVCLYSKADRYYSCAVNIAPAQLSKVLPQVENVWKSLYPNDVYTQEFVDESIKEMYETDTTLLKFNQLFSVLAILIGCIGVFGLVSFMAIRMKKEIGIRKALGAGVDNILWLFVKEFVQLLLVSLCIAVPFTWYCMNNWLKDFEYRLTISPSSFILSVVLTFGLVIITISAKSIKAALTNPIDNLRGE